MEWRLVHVHSTGRLSPRTLSNRTSTAVVNYFQHERANETDGVCGSTRWKGKPRECKWLFPFSAEPKRRLYGVPCNSIGILSGTKTESGHAHVDCREEEPETERMESKRVAVNDATVEEACFRLRRLGEAHKEKGFWPTPFGPKRWRKKTILALHRGTRIRKPQCGTEELLVDFIFLPGNCPFFVLHPLATMDPGWVVCVLRFICLKAFCEVFAKP